MNTRRTFLGSLIATVCGLFGWNEASALGRERTQVSFPGVCGVEGCKHCAPKVQEQVNPNKPLYSCEWQSIPVLMADGASIEFRTTGTLVMENISDRGRCGSLVPALIRPGYIRHAARYSVSPCGTKLSFKFVDRPVSVTPPDEEYANA